MNAVTLLHRRLSTAPPSEQAQIAGWLKTAQRQQERNKSRCLRHYVAQGMSASDPETHYRAEVLAGVRL